MYCDICILFRPQVMQTVTNPSRSYNPVAHMLSGAISGGVAAAITTPLDVCKTFLNTQQSQVSVDFFLIIYELFDVFLFFEKYQFIFNYLQFAKIPTLI